MSGFAKDMRKSVFLQMDGSITRGSSRTLFLLCYKFVAKTHRKACGMKAVSLLINNYKEKRESPRLKPWDESTFLFFKVFFKKIDIFMSIIYKISHNIDMKNNYKK